MDKGSTRHGQEMDEAWTRECMTSSVLVIRAKDPKMFW